MVIIFQASPSHNDSKRWEYIEEFRKIVSADKNLNALSSLINGMLDAIGKAPIRMPFMGEDELKAFAKEGDYKDFSIEPSRGEHDYSQFVDYNFKFEHSFNDFPDFEGKFSWSDFDREKSFAVGNDYVNELRIKIKTSEKEIYTLLISNIESIGAGDMIPGTTLSLEKE